MTAATRRLLGTLLVFWVALFVAGGFCAGNQAAPAAFVKCKHGTETERVSADGLDVQHRCLACIEIWKARRQRDEAREKAASLRARLNTLGTANNGATLKYQLRTAEAKLTDAESILAEVESLPNDSSTAAEAASLLQLARSKVEKWTAEVSRLRSELGKAEEKEQNRKELLAEVSAAENDLRDIERQLLELDKPSNTKAATDR